MAMFHATMSKHSAMDGSRCVSSYFDATMSTTAHLDVIVSLSFALSYDENMKFRAFGGYDETISVKAVKETIFKLVDIVEIAIRNEMKVKRGAIMHDGWTKNGSHYSQPMRCL